MMIPGEIIPAQEAIFANQGREITRLTVINKGDRPIQVGSHYHFFETNPALAFDRQSAVKKRLNIPSGNAVRFEPGEEKTIELVPFGGSQNMVGFRKEGKI